MVIIIGLIGQKRVGKDTVANIIKSIHDGFKIFALADPIKDIARIMFNFTENQLYSDEKDIIDEKWNIKPREFFEQFGTEIMQYDIYKYLPNLKTHIPERKFWVISLLNKIKHLDSNLESNNISRGIIITDIRGLHELEEIRKFNPNSVFIKITRPGISKINVNDHITQIESFQIPDDQINYHINNSGTLENLEKQTKEILQNIYDKLQ